MLCGLPSMPVRTGLIGASLCQNRAIRVPRWVFVVVTYRKSIFGNRYSRAVKDYRPTGVAPRKL